MKVIVEKDKIKLLEQATKELKNILSQDKHILFLTSGGSAFDLLKNLEISSRNISIGVLDERYSIDPAVNNFSQLQATEFFQKREKMFDKILDTKVLDGESLEDFADRFDSLLKKWKEQNPDGIIVSTMGMGADGHTSGIMPHPENELVFEGLFNDPRKWVVGYDAGDKNPYPERATTTLAFLKNEIDFAVVYVVGEGKKDALVRVMAENGTLAETPARLAMRSVAGRPARVFHEMKNVSLFTDITFD